MIFPENRLPANDSREISCLICYFWKKQQNLNLSSAANYRWRFLGQCHDTSTVKSEILANSVKRHICLIKNSLLGHDLPTSVDDTVISQGFYFHEIIRKVSRK